MELKNDITRNPVKLGAVGGTIGLATGAVTNFIKQKNILANGDEFLKKTIGQLETKKKFHNEFFDGTREAADLAIKKIDDAIKAVQDYVKAGKVNFKQVGKSALITGGILALLCAACGIFNKRSDKEIENQATILSNQLAEKKVL